MRPTCSHSLSVADSPSVMLSVRARKALPELAHQRHGDVQRNRRRESDDDVTDMRVFRVLDVAPRAIDLLEDAARMLEQTLAGLGRSGATTVAKQQVLPQLDLEAAHMAAHRRLRDAQHPRGPAEAAEVDDVDEIGELFEVHRIPIGTRPRVAAGEPGDCGNEACCRAAVEHAEIA